MNGFFNVLTSSVWVIFYCGFFLILLAELLGLPYAPPYLGLTANNKINISTGVNYASGSAGILQETGNALVRDCQKYIQCMIYLRILVKCTIFELWSMNVRLFQNYKNSTISISNILL